MSQNITVYLTNIFLENLQKMLFTNNQTTIVYFNIYIYINRHIIYIYIYMFPICSGTFVWTITGCSPYILSGRCRSSVKNCWLIWGQNCWSPFFVSWWYSLSFLKDICIYNIYIRYIIYIYIIYTSDYISDCMMFCDFTFPFLLVGALFSLLKGTVSWGPSD